jgi:hypothetical protein
VLVEGEDLKALISKKISSLFTPMAGVNVQRVLECVTPRVTPSMNKFLASDFTKVEVKKALDDMGDLKASRANGMLAIFYKKFWGTVGDIVVGEVLQVLRGGSIPPEGWNELLLYSSQRFRTPTV